MLTVKDLSTIGIELLLNRAPSNNSQEALEVRRQMAIELKEMEAQGIMPEFPDDFEG